MRGTTLSLDRLAASKPVLPSRLRILLRRYVRDIMILLFGVFLMLGVAALISAFETNGHSRVYAVHTSAAGVPGEVQTGLMGVINSVTGLQRFSENVRYESLTGNGRALAGAVGVDRWVIDRGRIGEGIKPASQLSYYAEQILQQNRLASDDYYTLVRIVEAEATGGDLKSKMIVAGVVLNRVKDRRFPDSIQEVVWQNEGGIPQFSPTQDGRIYSVHVTDETYEAVDRVLSGEDLTQGALFFFARNTSADGNVRWFDNTLVKLFEYGGHEYFTFKEE